MLFFAMTTGILSGVLGATFSLALDRVTEIHQRHPGWIWCLPLAGGLLFSIRRKWIRGSGDTGWLRIVWIFLGGTVSHWVGASVGREGAIVQMSTTGSEWMGSRIGLKMPIPPALRRSLGLSAGFAAAIGNPIAGSFFSWEVGGKRGHRETFLILMSAVSGVITMQVLGASLLMIPPLPTVNGIWSPLLTTLILGLTCGVLGRLFSSLRVRFERPSHWLPDSPIRVWIGGSILMLMLVPEEMRIYRGLGIETIGGSFAGSIPWEAPLLKLILTLLSLTLGFTGGEFIPLVFIGATAGNLLNQWIPLDSALLPTLGASVVFGAAARLPMTAFALSCIWSGWSIVPWAMLAHGIAALVTKGAPSIYGKTYWTSNRSPER